MTRPNQSTVLIHGRRKYHAPALLAFVEVASTFLVRNFGLYSVTVTRNYV